MVATPAPPTSTTSPMKRSARPTMSAALGPGGPLSEAGITAFAGSMRTPKAKAPPATWPSTWEKVRQETVYTPVGSGLRATRSCSGLPGTSWVGPCWNRWPPVESTSIDERRGSGASPKVMVTSGGACCRLAPLSGTEDCRSAWADARSGSAAAAPSTTSTAISPRIRRRMS